MSGSSKHTHQEDLSRRHHHTTISVRIKGPANTDLKPLTKLYEDTFDKAEEYLDQVNAQAPHVDPNQGDMLKDKTKEY